MPVLSKYEGHVEGVKCLAFTPDGEYLASGCTGGLVKIWRADPPVQKNQLIIENVHDLGVTSCDFSQRYQLVRGTRNMVYRLATGGYDTIVKVHRLKQIDDLSVEAHSFINLVGHGGSITEVRFSSKSSDVLASTSIDRTARIWNPISGLCLSIIDKHAGIVNCCAFSPNDVLFVTGSLDKTVTVWKVPFFKIDDNPSTEFECETALQPDCSANDLDLGDLSLQLDGLVLGLNHSCTTVPDRLLCPITRQIMTDPVICSDKFTYERKAIMTWLSTGRNTSPMTNVPLSSTSMTRNKPLLYELRKFILENGSGE